MNARSLWSPRRAVALTCVLIFSGFSAHASTTCDTQYLFGAGLNAMNLCISDDGNLVGFESPVASEHIGVGTIGEGYAVCTGSQVNGYDAGFDEFGWEPATKTQPSNGQTFPLIVTRTTTDGLFRLEQTFAINANQSGQSPEREVTIAMKLTNLSAATINNVRLTRFVDFDVDGSSDGDIFSASRDTLSAQQGKEESPGIWINDPLGHGISLTALNFLLTRNIEIHTAADWATNHTVCATGSSLAGPTNVPAGDFVGRVIVRLGNMAAGASKTVNFVYRRF